MEITSGQGGLWLGGDSLVCISLFLSLSKVLNQAFRLDYCRLWRALMKADMKGVERYSRRLGAGDMFALFACVLTARSWAALNAGISRTAVTSLEVRPSAAAPACGVTSPAICVTSALGAQASAGARCLGDVGALWSRHLLPC